MVGCLAGTSPSPREGVDLPEQTSVNRYSAPWCHGCGCGLLVRHTLHRCGLSLGHTLRGCVLLLGHAHCLHGPVWSGFPLPPAVGFFPSMHLCGGVASAASSDASQVVGGSQVTLVQVRTQRCSSSPPPEGTREVVEEVEEPPGCSSGTSRFVWEVPGSA